jgi:hypothetical protein
MTTQGLKARVPKDWVLFTHRILDFLLFIVISPARKGSKSQQPLVSEDSFWPSLFGHREFLASRWKVEFLGSRWKVGSSWGVPMEVAFARKSFTRASPGRCLQADVSVLLHRLSYNPTRHRCLVVFRRVTICFYFMHSPTWCNLHCGFLGLKMMSLRFFKNICKFHRVESFWSRPSSTKKILAQVYLHI